LFAEEEEARSKDVKNGTSPPALGVLWESMKNFTHTADVREQKNLSPAALGEQSPAGASDISRMNKLCRI
jgi:hypothetical protein